MLFQIKCKINSEAQPTPHLSRLRGPGNEVLLVKGHFSAKLVRGNHKTEQELNIAEGLHRTLLGRPAIESLQIVQRVQVSKLGK